MRLILATNNRHKGTEFKRIFTGHEILTPSDVGLEFSYDETGSTYLENALAKAKALFQKIDQPVLADDSGLSVPALGGEPGIFSARYGSGDDAKNLTDSDRYRHLLSRMEGTSDRRAFFVCCMVLIIEEYRFYLAQETLQGIIAEKPSGSGGFGYDPVFSLPEYGKTVAELPDGLKDTLSHRGRSGRRILSLLSDMNL
jgi:XTP/dITP diphosphohydrolase